MPDAARVVRPGSGTARTSNGSAWISLAPTKKPPAVVNGARPTGSASVTNCGPKVRNSNGRLPPGAGGAAGLELSPEK